MHFSITECKKVVQNLKQLTFFNLSIKETNTNEYYAVIRQIYECLFNMNVEDAIRLLDRLCGDTEDIIRR